MSLIRKVSSSGGPVLRFGHFRKLKTLKKKYFVLCGEAPGYPACLEYYDDKKKFENRQPPKRRIFLHNCFCINKYSDTRHKYCIVLNTMDDYFCFVLESESEMEDWLSSMLLLQSGGQCDGKQSYPIYDHVWQVNIQKKELGESKKVYGPYRLCLTNQAITFIKLGAKQDTDSIKFPLKVIRRCGFDDRIFFMEMGKLAVTGAGGFWIETKDLASNIYATILNAMTNLKSDKPKAGSHQII